MPGNKLYPLVSTCCRQHVSCVGNKIVASLLPVCCWIQRDTSRPWHKWIVIMSPRYISFIESSQRLNRIIENKHRVKQSTCIQNEQLVSGNTCPSTYMYPDTSCSSETTCCRATCCPRVNAALVSHAALLVLQRLTSKINWGWSTAVVFRTKVACL